VPKLLDELTVGADGRLWVAAGIGQLLRLDPTTGAACVLYSGPLLSSARFALGFPPFVDPSDLFLTSESGEIIHLQLTPAAAGA
jgi:hypothetical protein